jgi:hypothetical protein
LFDRFFQIRSAKKDLFLVVLLYFWLQNISGFDSVFIFIFYTRARALKFKPFVCVLWEE